MSKKCPYCNSELELGYIQCRDGITWSKKKRLVAALPSFNSSSVVLAKGGGMLSGSVVEAYCCKKCKKVIIDYNNLNQIALE